MRRVAFGEVLTWARRQSWVIVVNLSRDPLTVWATLIRSTGPERRQVLALGPRTRTGREVGEWFGLGPGDWSDSVEIGCSALCAVDVIGWDVEQRRLVNPAPMVPTLVCGF